MNLSKTIIVALTAPCLALCACETNRQCENPRIRWSSGNITVPHDTMHLYVSAYKANTNFSEPLYVKKIIADSGVTWGPYFVAGEDYLVEAPQTKKSYKITDIQFYKKNLKTGHDNACNNDVSLRLNDSAIFYKGTFFSGNGADIELQMPIR